MIAVLHAADTVLPDRYAVLREFDPGCTGRQTVSRRRIEVEWIELIQRSNVL